jgi:hypothetical protein
MKLFTSRLLTFLLLTALAGCSSRPVAQVQPSSVTPSATLVDSRGDLYETTYLVCDDKDICAALPDAPPHRVKTWGRPTEIGALYYQQYADQVKSWFTPLKKMPQPSDDTTFAGSAVLFKSRGIPIYQLGPIATEVFSPDPLATDPLMPIWESRRIKKNVGETRVVIKIVSIKKLDESVKSTLAQVSLGKQGLNLSYFYDYLKKNPTASLAPQQVEKITWQEGQPPQLIIIKQQ